VKLTSKANRHILNTKAFFHWCSFASVLRNSSKARTESKVPTIKTISDNALLYQSMKSGLCYSRISRGKLKCKGQVQTQSKTCTAAESRVPAVERSLNLCSANQKNTICLINICFLDVGKPMDLRQ
ncbi:hypothetical protein PO909_004825, partial [Leuciscus waleckii]